MTLYSIENYSNQDSLNLQNHLSNIINNNTIFFCVGTDKFIFDCIGPLTGSILKYNIPDLNVFGTLKNPITALNLNDSYNYVINNFPNNNILVIDAAISDSKLNKTILYNEPASPAFGSIGKIGTHKIISYTNKKSDFNPFNNNNRLYDASKISNFIASSIINTIKGE